MRAPAHRELPAISGGDGRVLGQLMGAATCASSCRLGAGTVASCAVTAKSLLFVACMTVEE
jgi:hypothetical protein